MMAGMKSLKEERNRIRSRVRAARSFLVGCVRVAVLLFVLFLGPAMAWEVSLDSLVLSFRYRYHSQMGSAGFFGPYDRDESSTGGNLASINGWFGKDTVSGTTQEFSQLRLFMFPSLKVNPAVSVKGLYRIDPPNPNRVTTSNDPSLDTLVGEGRWTRLWINAQTPLGLVTYGTRAFRQACGLQYESATTAEDVTESGARLTETFVVQSSYGPFTLGMGFCPWRVGSNAYWNKTDHNAARVATLLGYLQYTGQDLEAGLGGFYLSANEGPEGQTSAQARREAVPANRARTDGWIYAKYFDGRFFFNSEADWYYQTVRYQSSQDGSFYGTSAVVEGGGGSRFAPDYRESWRFMIETGAVVGPGRVSFLYARMPGPDRRHGILIDRQPFVKTEDTTAFGVFIPYCLLMGQVFRAGVNSYRDLTDANVFGLRLDYLAASNLGVFGSVLHARRLSHGYGWGFVRPDPTKVGTVSYRNRGSFTDPIPSIPDNDMGWEVGLGGQWRLLENWRVFVQTGYWIPGKWFSYACIDRSVPDWDKPAAWNHYGVRPDRTIDPVFGMRLHVEVSL
jgi:hypothetical protein